MVPTQAVCKEAKAQFRIDAALVMNIVTVDDRTSFVLLRSDGPVVAHDANPRN